MSDLTRDVLKDFADIVIDESNKDEEITAYGTTVESDGVDYVKLDGSSLLTPITTTTDIKPGERVLVLIKNHQAIIIGNSSNPSAGKQEVNDLKESVNLDKASIKDLVANNVTINESLKANSARIDSLEATNVEINGKLTADRADITRLDTEKLSADAADIRYAKVDDLSATNADIVKLNADYAKFKDASVKRLDANEASIKDLDTKKLSAEDAEIKYLTIDKAKATYLEAGDFTAYKATVENLLAAKASIEELETNYLKASKIESTYAKISALDAVTANIDTLNTDLANVEKLVANKAEIKDLDAANAKIETLVSDVANVNKLIAGKVDADYVQAEIVKATSTITDDLKAIHAVVDTLDTKYATIEQLNAAKANLETLIAKKASVDDLNAAKATIGQLDTLVANINAVLAGSVGTGTLQTIHLTAENVVIDDAVIKSANIEGLDVSKLNAGTISTDKFTIQSDDGGVIISGSTQQFKDKNGKVRLQIGKDAQGNFNFIVFGEDGTTAIYNQNGITKSAVPDGLITDQMVSDTANIQAKKVQYIDKDGNKTLQTVIEQEQGKVTELIKETEMTKSELTTLSDKYNETVKTVEGNTTTIANIKTSVDTISGNVTKMDSRITTVETTADGLKTSVSKAQTDATNANDKIDNLKVGGRNLLLNSKYPSSISTNNNATYPISTSKVTEDGDTFIRIKRTNTTINPTKLSIYNDIPKSLFNYAGTKGRQLTASVKARVSHPCKSYIYFVISPGEKILATKVYDLKTTWTTMSVTIDDFPDMNDYTKLRFLPWETYIPTGVVDDFYLDVTDWKLELGNTPTDWTPAPEDVNSSIQNAQTIAEQTASKFSWLVKSGTSSTDFTLTDRTAQLVADNINLNGLVKFTGLNSETQTKINKIDNLKVGGRNLFLNTGIEVSNNEYNITNYKPAKDPLVAGKTYTITICFTPAENMNDLRVYFSGGNICPIDFNKIIPGKKQTQSLTFIMQYQTGMTPSDNSWYAQANVHRFPNDGSVTGNTTIHWMKIEEGTVATDWTPAPEDKADQSVIDNWASDAVVGGETTINGGYIKSNTIKTDQLAVDDIFATGSAVMNIINAQEINANRITSGLLSAERINAYGLSITRKATGQQTFNISNDGEVTLRGSVSSYDYNIGKTGWSIRNDGTAEFNDVNVRGSVITNDGGIVTAGGSGRNLLKNSAKELTTTRFIRINVFNILADYIDKDIAISFDAKINDEGIDGRSINVYGYQNSGITIRDSKSFKLTKNYERYSMTTKVVKKDIPSGYSLGSIGFYDYKGENNYSIKNVKIELGIVATAWSPAPEDQIKQVRFWAGTSYEKRDSAPFIVYNDGSIKATKGQYSGLWTGDIRIGNISIVDPSENAGNDSMITIQHGGNGIKRVQLTDDTWSKFCQDVIVADDHETTAITLKQDGIGVFTKGINVADNVSIASNSLTIANHELTTNDDGSAFLFNSDVDIGSSAQTGTLTVHGDGTLDNVTVNNTLYFGDVLKITKVANGVNIDVIKKTT